MPKVLEVDPNKVGFTELTFQPGKGFMSQTSREFLTWQAKSDTSPLEPLLSAYVSTDLRLLKQIDSPRYSLCGGIVLEVETDEAGMVVVSNSHLNVYGVGETIEEATDELSSMLIDLYEELEASKDALSTHLLRQLSYLRNILALR